MFGLGQSNRPNQRLFSSGRPSFFPIPWPPSNGRLFSSFPVPVFFLLTKPCASSHGLVIAGHSSLFVVFLPTLVFRCVCVCVCVAKRKRTPLPAIAIVAAAAASEN
jgi:hypothetical protein